MSLIAAWGMIRLTTLYATLLDVFDGCWFDLEVHTIYEVGQTGMKAGWKLCMAFGVPCGVVWILGEGPIGSTCL